MFPFPDYYARFGLIIPQNLSYASSVSSRYDIHEEVIFLILFLLLLSIEIFISIVQVLRDCKEKTNNRNDLLKNVYVRPIDSSSITTKTYSTIASTVQGKAFLLLNTSTKTISETAAEF